MERILLIEPNYKNKYPPIGLMKISTYFKSKKDIVFFHKGLLPQIEAATYDKVFVTTLFTFDFEMCIETIRYYIAIVGIENVFVGGIAATIMPEKFSAAIPSLKLLLGQLTSSTMLGYDDDVNIDNLELDYDILWDISYVYPEEDSYFIYTSRGCPRKCEFCAVKTLEPKFIDCQNIKEQISRVDEKFGPKRSLLIMDNNILYSEHLDATITVLEDLGFGKQNSTMRKNSNMPYYLKSLWQRRDDGREYKNLLNRIKNDFSTLKMARVNIDDRNMLFPAIEFIENDDDKRFIKYLEDNELAINSFFIRYNFHKIKRYVDFNQGLDARLLTNEKAQILSRVNIKPCRIAFDDLKTKDEYFKALDFAIDNGIHNFSNYLLYNYKDHPEDLWERLFLNVDYCEEKNEALTLFSFPMKYAAIDQTDRTYVGKYWNEKYLRSINVILNVTSGVVAKEKDFFLRAFGESSSEFLEILTMPSDFIRYREYFSKNNMIQTWQDRYRALTSDEKAELITILSFSSKEFNAKYQPHSSNLDEILGFYEIKKSSMENNKAYYLRTISN